MIHALRFVNTTILIIASISYYRCQEEYSEFDAPHMITTYTALLSLSILRDDFSRLDRPGLIKFLQASQRGDGRYASEIFRYCEPSLGFWIRASPLSRRRGV